MDWKSNTTMQYAPDSSAYWRHEALIARMELELLRQSVVPSDTLDAGFPEEASSLRDRLAAMQASQSWRITAPLRAATTALRAFRERIKARAPSIAFLPRATGDDMRERARVLEQFSSKSEQAVLVAMICAPEDS